MVNQIKRVMKELSIKEKAKCYDEALKVLHKYDGINIMFTQDLKEEMFPELREEYEDEKTRKELLAVINDLVLPDEQQSRFIAWLENTQYAIDHAKREGFQLGYKAGIEKQGEQKPTWTQEDEMMLFSVIWHLRDSVNKGYQSSPAGKLEPWVKTLKDRVQPRPKQEWCEEDENMLESLTDILKRYFSGEYGKKCIDWLKSFKERYIWKPSEGQLECLGYAIDKAEKDWSPLTNNRIYLTLKALKEQLEKL